MINLNPYSGDSHSFLDQVISQKRNSKQDSSYKARIDGLTSSLKLHFTNYDNNFALNNLISLSSHGYIGQNKVDILKLYKYDSKVLTSLKYELTTNSDNRRINTCQNCTINEVSSLDHFVPKEEFPEFSVHPKNLFPCCTTCNSYKNNIWRENNNFLFLNLYLDILPPEQYVFVNIDLQDATPTTNFSIENRFSIDNNLFSVIKKHYDRLYLPKRFKENSHDVIVELINNINSLKQYLEIEKIIAVIKDEVVRSKQSFGQNYWKALIHEALINSNEFIKLIS